MLRDKIEKTGKYRVAMTRTEDTFVALADRVEFARVRQAALFISIHADALARGDGDAQGATIYTLSERASDAAAARFAEAENRADVIAGLDLSAEPSDVAGILIDLAKRETKTFSLQFARTMVGELKHTARLHQNPLKSARFVVLRAPDVPSVLVELGYVSNKADLRSLISAEWRDAQRRRDRPGDQDVLRHPPGGRPELRTSDGYGDARSGEPVSSPENRIGLSFNIKQRDLGGRPNPRG